jgi:hypothetical protein
MGTLERAKITRSEIKDAISRSGYLIEQRVLRLFSKRGYPVIPNPIYLDPISEKTREIDMQVECCTSFASEDSTMSGLHWSICCECENNGQPVAFFPYEPLTPDLLSELVKYVGIPMKIWRDGRYVALSSFLPFYKFHHYCKGNIAAQYCSFAKPKGSGNWIATHLEEQHDTSNSLALAIEDQINRFYSKEWLPPKDNEVEPILLMFKYPLRILGGELKEAHISKRGLVVKNVKHVKFVKSLHISGKVINYLIDVITEDYLIEYLSIIEAEMEKVQRLITRHKKIITQSIERIVKDTKSAGKVDSYRKILTLE